VGVGVFLSAVLLSLSFGTLVRIRGRDGVQNGALKYNMYMSSHEPVTVSEARGQLGSLVSRARTLHEPVYLTRHGQQVAAIVDADDLARLIESSEDLADIRAAAAARAEMEATQAEAIPWDEVKADLGLA